MRKALLHTTWGVPPERAHRAMHSSRIAGLSASINSGPSSQLQEHRTPCEVLPILDLMHEVDHPMILTTNCRTVGMNGGPPKRVLLPTLQRIRPGYVGRIAQRIGQSTSRPGVHPRRLRALWCTTPKKKGGERKCLPCGIAGCRDSCSEVADRGWLPSSIL